MDFRSAEFSKSEALIEIQGAVAVEGAQSDGKTFLRGGVHHLLEEGRADSFVLPAGVDLGVYKLDNGVFPSTEQGLEALIAQPSGVALPNWKGPYLDPPVIRVDQRGHAYIYKCPGVKVHDGYDLYSSGPNGVAGDDDDIGNWQ